MCLDARQKCRGSVTHIKVNERGSFKPLLDKRKVTKVEKYKNKIEDAILIYPSNKYHSRLSFLSLLDKF